MRMSLLSRCILSHATIAQLRVGCGTHRDLCCFCSATPLLNAEKWSRDRVRDRTSSCGVKWGRARRPYSVSLFPFLSFPPHRKFSLTVIWHLFLHTVPSWIWSCISRRDRAVCYQEAAAIPLTCCLPLYRHILPLS